MYNQLIIYRPTAAAIAANSAAGRPPLPREIHVHASGLAVAEYADGTRHDFPTVHGMYEHHHLVAADLEQIR